MGFGTESANFSWSELPDIQSVYSSLKNHAQTKARLRIAKLELEIYQAKMSQAKARNAAVKLIGVDEESEQVLRDLIMRVAGIENELDELDAEVKFNDYRREAAKIISYKQRI